MALGAACIMKKDPEEVGEELPELIIGSDNYEPYNYLDDDGKPVGIDVELAEAVCEQLGYTPVFQYIVWDKKDEYLDNGKVDCLWGSFTMNGREDEHQRARQKASNYKYTKSFMALAMPAAYCVLDAAGTFADSRVLEIISRTVEDYEASANVAYELTFLLAAVVCFVYVVLIKRDRLGPKMEAPKYLGAVCETAGQFAYIYAISDTAHLAMSAPIISSYCAASVLWSRIFLKEKLSWKHYAMICLVVIGIAIMGFFDL